MLSTFLVTVCLPFICFLLGLIAYFLKQHLDNFRDLQEKVEGHEVRITILETYKKTNT